MEGEDEIPERKLRKKTKFKPRGPIRLLVAAMGLNSLHMGNGFEIIEENEPHSFFDNPQNARTQKFLGQILQH